MDRKDWARIVERAIDRYRHHVAGEPDHDSDDAAWSPEQIEVSTIEDHITEALQCLADVGGEQLA